MKAMSIIGITVIFSVICVIGCNQAQNNVPSRLTFTTSFDAVIIDDSNGTWKSDDFVLEKAVITNDSLDVTVSYRGGCKDHFFNLVSPAVFLESEPVEMPLCLIHNAKCLAGPVSSRLSRESKKSGDTFDDSCEAWITEDYSFNLTPIKEFYVDSYRVSTGIINVILKDADRSGLTYQF